MNLCPPMHFKELNCLAPSAPPPLHQVKSKIRSKARNLMLNFLSNLVEGA